MTQKDERCLPPKDLHAGRLFGNPELCRQISKEHKQIVTKNIPKISPGQSPDNKTTQMSLSHYIRLSQGQIRTSALKFRQGRAPAGRKYNLISPTGPIFCIHTSTIKYIKSTRALVANIMSKIKDHEKCHRGTKHDEFKTTTQKLTVRH